MESQRELANGMTCKTKMVSDFCWFFFSYKLKVKIKILSIKNKAIKNTKSEKMNNLSQAKNCCWLGLNLNVKKM